ncbi:MAG TPA: SH3 domain-containing protein [Leptospiraceae bacterium]|nr:SH3 domain-containing protein [Leptospiraceae bacterium]HMW04076.1 SH3 domain-containing protein [Leptospiraceae bacterium]HMX30857.1 SH3 domain-containing protein [Leptospiraceae bacterium]HMY30070.1 SH3 domain-containing protein [Leptospiraceae bacterium]HMZ62743.1 SH3 domain-containing protein [Leptospiraceae bacterium]
MIRFISILYIIFVVFTFPLFSKPSITYKPGDRLYVLSKSGLNLRDKPSRNGRFLQAVPFGTMALVRQITDKELDVDGIKGFWVKVIADDREGYLFDGYLSLYPPPVATLPSRNTITLKQYAEKFLPKDTKVTQSTDDSAVTTSTLILPLARIEEAYLLGVCFLLNFDRYKFPIKPDKQKSADIEIDFDLSRDKNGKITNVSVTETYVQSGGTVSLIVTDLGNKGVEIKTIFSEP